jgi:hypothetical protein
MQKMLLCLNIILAVLTVHHLFRDFLNSHALACGRGGGAGGGGDPMNEGNSTSILLIIVGRKIVKRMVVGSRLVSDDFPSGLYLVAVVGFVGTRGKFLPEGKNPRKVTQMR